jgi:hypothetical protein
MERFDRPCSRSAGRGSFFERATENAGANLVGGSNFPAYDFLIEKYENKDPSKTLINIASRLILIAKKTHIAKYEQLRDPQIRIGPEPRQIGCICEAFAVLATFPREIIGQ